MESALKAVFARTVIGMFLAVRGVARRLRQRPDGRVNQMAHEVPALKIIRPALGLVFYLALLDWLVPGTRLEWAHGAVPTPLRWGSAAGCLLSVLIMWSSFEALGQTYRGGVGLWDDHLLVVAGPYDVPPPAVPLAMLDLKPLAVPGAEAF